MNVCGVYNATESEPGQSWSRATSEEVILFIFMHFLRDSNDGGTGLRTASNFYGI